VKRILLIIICLCLSGCSTLEKTRGLSMEVNLVSGFEQVWRCYSLSEDIIKITEENYFFDGEVYQFKFLGVSEGTGIVECMTIDNMYKITYEVIVDNNKFIKLALKEGNYIKEEVPDPIFR